MTRSELSLGPPPRRPVDRTVCLPGSKSLTNRALLAAAMAEGRSKLEGLLLADDTRLMLRALVGLGVRAEVDETRRVAVVNGCRGRWPEGEVEIFCGNAGTVLRFLAAACCIGHGVYRLDGVPRLRERPIGGLVDALRDLGADIRCEDQEGFCPLAIHAKRLRGGRTRFHTTPSSQFISALLLATPLAQQDVLIDLIDDPPSQPYITMTLKVMESFGVTAVERDMRKFIVPSQQNYRACSFEVEPDATAASYFFAAAAITGGRVTVNGLGTESCQGDLRFLTVLEQMGCRTEQGSRHSTVWGPADGRLCGVDVDLNAMPDVAQTLAVLAAFAEGTTRIRNVANLRLKETDRARGLANELGRMGVATEIHDDGLSVRPSGVPTAASVRTYKDHRMAMSFALAGLRLDGMVILGADCVGKTFPEFFDLWAEF